ncbi:TPA: hypothetical protein RY759_002278 [Staphylococcus aureus]|nr:hypothetical protein [Staphylococcus aureus]
MKVGGAPAKRISKRNSTDNASWRGPNKENFEKKFDRQCKLAGPQQREFRKEIQQTMQVGVGSNKEDFEKKFSSFALIMVKLHRYKVIGKINDDFIKIGMTEERLLQSLINKGNNN